MMLTFLFGQEIGYYRERMKQLACHFMKKIGSAPIDKGKLFFTEDHQLMNIGLIGNHHFAISNEIN